MECKNLTRDWKTKASSDLHEELWIEHTGNEWSEMERVWWNDYPWGQNLYIMEGAKMIIPADKAWVY